MVTDSTGPSRCLSFVVRSDQAHFRRIDGNVVKQSYRVMPRTTVAGMLAAIVGADRDSYYKTFALDHSSVAITPLFDLRSKNVGTTALSTSHNDLKSASRAQKGVKVSYPDTTKSRQLHNYELLVNPVYRIDLALDDETFYKELLTHLRAGTSVYTPSLGLSECLAHVDYLGEFEPDPVEADDNGLVTVQSALPDALDAISPTANVPYATEQSPGEMEATVPSGRKTTAFIDWVYPSVGFTPLADEESIATHENYAASHSERVKSLTVRADSVDAVTVGNRTVVFA